MGVELWIGEEFEYRHEKKALVAFLKNMVKSFPTDPTRFCVLANFTANSSPIDLAVIKNNGLAVIELKQVGGPVFGGENGEWTIREGNREIILKGGSKLNPYIQVRDYRISFLKFLNDRRDRFLLPGGRPEPQLHHVKAIVALSPVIPDGSAIDLSTELWLKVVGLNELHREVFRMQSHQLNLKPKEINLLLVDVLRLTRMDVSEYIATPCETVIAPTEPEPHISEPPVPVIEEPLEIPEPAISYVSESPPRHHGQTPCPICAMGVSKCALKSLSGRIEGISRSGDSRYEFRILSDDFEPYVITVHDCWNDYAARLQSLLDDDRSVPVRILHLEKEGGKLKVGQNSLVVIEPDWLINVTDMTQVEFCQRQLLLSRYISESGNAHMIRGNLVHQLFPDIWNSMKGPELEARRHELLNAQAEEFILSESSPDDILSKCDYSIKHLEKWVDQRKKSTTLRTETFVIAPSLGTKGKVDFLWEDLAKGGIVGIGELKTSQSQGKDPKPGHALQLMSYTLMMFSRGEITLDKVFALLLYSGNAMLGDTPNNLVRRLIPDIHAVRKAVNVRNELVLMELTGQAGFETNMNKCRGCRRMSTHCARIALLSNEKDTRPIETAKWLGSGQRVPTDGESAFFRHYSKLISAELRALKEMHAELWRKTPEQRESLGEAFKSTGHSLEQSLNGRYRYRLSGSNTSDLRAGDSLLISDRKGPARGRVALGTLASSSKDALIISTNEEIRFEPVWVDPYTTENLTIRMFKGLYRWISNPNDLNDLILGERSPDFVNMPLTEKSLVDILKKERLNDQQAKALEAAICSKSYCVVHGPPGSGKTKLIKAIVKAHLLLDRRVLICTGTNRALDEAMKPLVKGGMSKQALRLGNLASVTNKDVRSTALQFIMDECPKVEEKISAGQEALKDRSIVGITASSLQSGKYDKVLGEFDLAIIDEAAQLTVPATLGCVSYAKRFVLIGDHNQLPAVVQSESVGLDDFDDDNGQWSHLSKSLFEILYERCEKNAGREVIFLKDQYRMNDHVCAIPGSMWYNRELRPATVKVGDARLTINHKNVSGLTRKLLDPEQSVKFVNVPLDSSAGPRTNQKEARIVCDIIRGLARGGFLLERKDAVAIICPRRAQVELVRRSLENLFAQDQFLDADAQKMLLDSVSTVDRFQGSQSDVVLVSLGMCDSLVSSHLADEKRLNVAMSRARHKLILLGNREALNQEDVFVSLFKTMETTLPYPDWCVEAG
jgi:DNA replication ATP-dependent helicase Dna2